MIHVYQLMIMRLVLLQQHQSHDHELEGGPAREWGRAAREPERATDEWGRALARGKAGL